MKCTYYAPDNKGQLKLVRKTKNGEAQEGKHTCLCNEREKEIYRKKEREREREREREEEREGTRERETETQQCRLQNTGSLEDTWGVFET